MANKVVQPENICHAEIDPLQSYTSVAARLVFCTYPHDLSLGKNRAMILWQINGDMHPITHMPIVTGADKNSNRAYVFCLSFGSTTFTYQAVLRID